MWGPHESAVAGLRTRCVAIEPYTKAQAILFAKGRRASLSVGINPTVFSSAPLTFRLNRKLALSGVRLSVRKCVSATTQSNTCLRSAIGCSQKS
jgi:hypothetical protein